MFEHYPAKTTHCLSVPGMAADWIKQDSGGT